MKSFLSAVLGSSFTLLGAISFGPVYPDVAIWGTHRGPQLRQWVGPEGSFNVRCLEPSQRTAIDLRPSDPPPQRHARSEIVLYNRWSDADPENWERLSISALAEGRGGHYRFGSERGGRGRFGRMVWAFEDVRPGEGLEPLVILSPDERSNTDLRSSHRVVIDPRTPYENESGLGVIFTLNGRPTFRHVESGPPDSAGVGYRSLRIRN